MTDETRQTPAATVAHGQSVDEAAADNFGVTAADLDEGDSECPNCGGEGWTFECFDGCCADADTGCDDCLRECDCQKQLTAYHRPEGK